MKKQVLSEGERLLFDEAQVLSEGGRLLFDEEQVFFQEETLLFDEKQVLFQEKTLFFDEKQVFFQEETLLFDEEQVLFEEKTALFDERQVLFEEETVHIDGERLLLRRWVLRFDPKPLFSYGRLLCLRGKSADPALRQGGREVEVRCDRQDRWEKAALPSTETAWKTGSWGRICNRSLGAALRKCLIQPRFSGGEDGIRTRV